MRTHSEGEVVRLKKVDKLLVVRRQKLRGSHAHRQGRGFEGIELAMDGAGDLTPQTTPAQLAQLKSAAEEIGIRLPSVASGLYWEHSFTSDDADERKRAHDTAVAQLHCAKALGADTILVIPGSVSVEFVPDRPTVPYDVAYERALEEMRALRAHRRGAEGQHRH